MVYTKAHRGQACRNHISIIFQYFINYVSILIDSNHGPENPAGKFEKT